ncbi:ImmA/IrrE family metallo-endopeptidase [Chryseobacterium bernardetii]|uniref:ImmA/IrrE family metallo-endopeptidase n=1 Tax=Chryseobacterium bernardetii TaxID=1241978 RepID=UPI00162A786D|nr:ImmA/IrrE family metallo-endopeptidase [Chryseobacterium bernardetii]
MNSIQHAQNLLSEIGWESPSDFTLLEIANYLNINIKEVPISGSQGRILINGNSAIITIDSGLTHEGKKNFVIAHEIGHFLMHKNLISIFSDTEKTLSDWHTKGPHENEANSFATELLMPFDAFKSFINKNKLSLNLIEKVSEYFNTSLLATFLRYVDIGDFPAMVVYMENNKIIWKKYSHDFPLTFLNIGSQVPEYTVAGDYFTRGNREEKPEKIEAIEWFANDFNIKYNKNLILWEQCYKVSSKGLISCIWTE